MRFIDHRRHIAGIDKEHQHQQSDFADRASLGGILVRHVAGAAVAEVVKTFGLMWFAESLCDFGDAFFEV